MKAGKLRDKLQLFQQGENEWGESAGLELIGTIPADVEEKAGKIQDENGAATMSETIEAEARYNGKLNADLVVGYNGKHYTITSLINSKRARRATIVAEVWRE